MKKLIYTVLAIGLFLLNVNAQSGWFQQTNPLGGNILFISIQYVSATEGWISTTNGKLLHTTNGGNNWTIVTPESVDTLYASADSGPRNISFVNSTTGWIIYTKRVNSNPGGAVVYKTTNGGVNWIKLTVPTYQAGFTLQFIDANNGCITLVNPSLSTMGLYRTTNGGTTWNLVPIPVMGIPFFVNSNSGWLTPLNLNGGFTRDTIRKTTDGGTTWTAPWGTNDSVRFTDIHFTDVNNGWQVGNYGKVLKTTNSGLNWSYITNTGIDISYKCNGVQFINPNTGWIGIKGSSDISNIVYTNNGGTTWIWQFSSSINNLKCFSFYDALNGGMITNSSNSGVIWRTTNGGVSVQNISTEIPSSYSLSQNYPNPFNPETKIKFQIKDSRFVTLKIYDLLGREVAILVNEVLKPGTYEVDWNASECPSGVYFYRLEAGEYTDVKKMSLLK